MDFTREPVIETVITPKEGFKLLLKSSKFESQEEYLLDALEVISFGQAVFYRCREKPKAFIVPVADFELIEVREARLVLKTMGSERTIKIAGGREPSKPREIERPEPQEKTEEEAVPLQETKGEGRNDRKRDRRRQSRKRRGRDEGGVQGNTQEMELSEEGSVESQGTPRPQAPPQQPFMMLAPPTTLISETLSRYRDDELFKTAFYSKEEKEMEGAAPAVQATTSFSAESKEEFDEGDRALFQSEGYREQEGNEESHFPMEQETERSQESSQETDWINEPQPNDEK